MNIFKNQNGLSLTQVLTAAALGALVISFALAQLLFNAKMADDIDQSMSTLQLRSTMTRTMVNNEILERALEADTVFQDCISGTATCPTSTTINDLALVNVDGSLMSSNTDQNGFRKDGSPCDGMGTDPFCVLKPKYFYNIVCEAAACGGRTTVNVLAQMHLIPLSGTPKVLSGSVNRFFSYDSTLTPVFPSGLSLTMISIFYKNSDGTIHSFGYNDLGQVSHLNLDTFVAGPIELTDFSGNTIRAKSLSQNGSGHSILARDDGTVWTVGYNDGGDLGQAGTTVIEDGTQAVSLFSYTALGGFSLSGTIATYAPKAKGMPAFVDQWRPVDGALGDPTVANVERVYAATQSFNLIVRTNGEVWGLGNNRGNRMGFPISALGAQPFTDPYGAPQTHRSYWDDRYPDGTLHSPTSPQSYAAIFSNLDGYGRVGGTLETPAAPGVHPKYNPPPASFFAPSIVSRPVKSFYLGADVGFELKDVVLGNFSGCAINQHDNAVCWGYNWRGSLGRGTLRKDIEDDITDNQAWSPGVAPDIPKRTASYLYGAMVGSMYAPAGKFQSPWDNPLFNDIPDGVAAPASFHNVVIDSTTKAALTNLVSITGSASHRCALQNTGRVYCWGNNSWGQLGRGYNCNFWSNGAQGLTGACRDIDVAMPVVDSTSTPISNAVKVVASGLRTYIITADGKLFASGMQRPLTGHFLGVSSSSTSYNYAREITAGGALGQVVDLATSINTAWGTTCILNTADELWCWGRNHTGDGTQARFIFNGNLNYETPVLVPVDITK